VSAKSFNEEILKIKVKKKKIKKKIDKYINKILI
jgi:hypothetical protein